MKGSFILAEKNIPAISVIIPLYNTEKYVGECLDSILAQTFEDYEVIVVDNCSTDNSAKIVESYIPKFNGRLQIIGSNRHYSCAGIPRNIGIQISHGEYISFVDSDDMITKTALVEFYDSAKKFDADVVACEKFYPFHYKEDLKKKIKPSSYQSGEFVIQPTLLSDDFLERSKKLLNKNFSWAVWSKLVRRKFILENNIQMIDAVGQDMIFTCCLVCSAPKYLIVPNIVNFYRMRNDSVYHTVQDDLLKVANTWIHSLDLGFKYFNEFLSRQVFFQQHSDIKYIILETVVKEFTNYFIKFYAQIPAYQIDEYVRHALEQIEDTTALTAYLFSRMNLFNVNLFNQQQEIQKLQANLQKSVQYLKNQSEIIESQRAEIEQLKAQLQQFQ